MDSITVDRWQIRLSAPSEAVSPKRVSEVKLLTLQASVCITCWPAMMQCQKYLHSPTASFSTFLSYYPGLKQSNAFLWSLIAMQTVKYKELWNNMTFISNLPAFTSFEQTLKLKIQHVLWHCIRENNIFRYIFGIVNFASLFSGYLLEL